MKKVPAAGPSPSPVLIVGEAPGEQESYSGTPFIGPSGHALDSMLSEAGIRRAECRVTNVAQVRPPRDNIKSFFRRKNEGTLINGKWVGPELAEGHSALMKEIAECNPRVIIALGNTPLWALTGHWGITDWRGSRLWFHDSPEPIQVLPTYHPAYVLRSWSDRPWAVKDLKLANDIRAGSAPKPPDWQFVTRPSMEDVRGCIDHAISSVAAGETPAIAADIETTPLHIKCLGFAWSKTEAISIPIMHNGSQPYWESPSEETLVVEMLRHLLTSVPVVWQNGLYDLQHIIRWWKFVPNFTDDTMLMQHALLPGFPKGLDFLSSIYCDFHRYWKSDGKQADGRRPDAEEWVYNCTDCVRTLEIWHNLRTLIHRSGLDSVYAHSLSLVEPVLFMMLRGIKIDIARIDTFKKELAIYEKDRQAWFKEVLGHELNVNSPVQVKRLLYDDLQLPVQKDRKTKKPTTGSDALGVLARKQPLVSPLIFAIEELRSASKFRGNFLGAEASPDGRFRTSYNIAGTETGRFSSSQDAFGQGLNLENIPRPYDPTDVRKAKAARLPNIRTTFIPDPGYYIFDTDLERADAAVVAAEAEEAELLSRIKTGFDIHSDNAELVGIGRQNAKQFVHLTNYGGGPRVCAMACGISVADAERGQSKYFARYPGIAAWHSRIMGQIQSSGYITNRFGRRRYYTDRINNTLLKEALAWIPQSTVADVINKGLRRVYETLPDVQLLLQNHDSVVYQVPAADAEKLVPQVVAALAVEIPYDPPLVIGTGTKWSKTSWGELETWRPLDGQNP